MDSSVTDEELHQALFGEEKAPRRKHWPKGKKVAGINFIGGKRKSAARLVNCWQVKGVFSKAAHPRGVGGEDGTLKKFWRATGKASGGTWPSEALAVAAWNDFVRMHNRAFFPHANLISYTTESEYSRAMKG
jgi:hypothetical protein